jgi:MHS family proline/betaine transporter-like MFS transporter
MVDCNWITLLGIVIYAIATPFVGKASDRLGHARVILAGVLFTIIAAYPIFLAFSKASLPMIILAQLTLATLAALCAGPSTAFLSDLFVTKVRYRGVAFGYCLGSGLIGGLAPMLASYLTKYVGNVLAPALCLIFYSVLGLIALIKSKKFS